MTNSKHVIVNGNDIGPDIFKNPVAAEAAFRPEWPGESGVRNNVVGDGLFEVTIGTPQGPMICAVDSDGNVRGVNEAQ